MNQITKELEIDIKNADKRFTEAVEQFSSAVKAFDGSIETVIGQLNKAIYKYKRSLINGGQEEKTPAEGAEDLIGKQIRFGGMEWTVLEQDDKTIFIVSNSYLPGEYEFGGTNIWARSTLREALHSWMSKWIYENEIEEYLVSMYVASMNEAGEVLDESIDQVRLLTLEEHLRYRRLGIMPKYTPDWQWTITALRGYAIYVWLVYSSGYVYGNAACHAHRCAPALTIMLGAPFELIS